MITEDDSSYTFEFEKYFAILPPFLLESKFYKNNGRQVEYGFSFNSENNPLWHSEETFREVLLNIGLLK